MKIEHFRFKMAAGYTNIPMALDRISLLGEKSTGSEDCASLVTERKVIRRNEINAEKTSVCQRQL
jgi:hypothetical protein